MTESSSIPPISVGVIGQGFMGRTHLAAYRAAQASGLPCRVVAIADLDPARRAGQDAAAGNLATGADKAAVDQEVRLYTTADELISDPQIELLSVCTPTDTHADLAIRALSAGKHVLVEKPVAVDPADIRRVAGAAAKAGRLCLPAMCMRFWPGWPWLHDKIKDGSLGALRTLSIQRTCSAPTWSPEFYKNPARTGGALGDLHIHDSDFVLWSLGHPAAVSSTGTIDHITTIYRFPSGPAHVVAEGGWDHQEGFGFRMRFTANFEKGTADFDLARGMPLRLIREGIAQPVLLPRFSGYEGEVRHAVEAVQAQREGRVFPLTAALDDAIAVADLLQLERRSLETGREVEVARKTEKAGADQR